MMVIWNKIINVSLEKSRAIELERNLKPILASKGVILTAFERKQYVQFGTLPDRATRIIHGFTAEELRKLQAEEKQDA